MDTCPGAQLLVQVTYVQFLLIQLLQRLTILAVNLTQATGSEVAQIDMLHKEIVEIAVIMTTMWTYHNLKMMTTDMHEDVQVVAENDQEENLDENDALGEEQEQKESL